MIMNVFDDKIMELLEQELKGNRYGKEYYRMILKSGQQFINWISKRKGLQKLRRKDIMDYQVFLNTQTNTYTGKPLEFSTIKHRYEAVKKICSILYRSGIIKENITHGLNLELSEVSSYKRRPLSRKEITAFLENISTEDNRGLRNRAFFELVYSSGLRVSEAVNLKVNNIDLKKRELLVTGKYDRERLVPFSDIACDFLLLHLGIRKDNVDNYVFTGNRENKHILRTSMIRIFRKLLKTFGMDKKELCIHSIRHSTATHLLDNGAGVRQVQELLGHKSIESTVLYTHIQTEGLFKIYKKYHPREHELFEVLDKAYDKRLESIMRDHNGRLLTGKRIPKCKQSKNTSLGNKRG